MFQCVPEEAVGNAVDFSSTLLAPFTLTLSEASELFDGYVSVELFSQPDDFISYLPNSCLHVVPLSSAGPFQFESSLASGNRVPIPLEFGSSLLKAELPHGNVLSTVGLLQHSISAYDGDGDLGAVYIYAHPVRPNGGFWRFLLEDDEKSEISPHDDAGHFPAIFDVLLKPSIGPISAYGKPYSGVVQAKAENRVSTLSPSEAEGASVEAYNTLPYALTYCFSLYSRRSFYDELGRHIILASEQTVCLFMQFSPRTNVADVAESFLNHAEEGDISLSKHLFLSLRRFEKVQRQTLSHRHPHNMKMEVNLKRYDRNSSTPKEGGLPCGGLVNMSAKISRDLVES